jgi:hypothetical protein
VPHPADGDLALLHGFEEGGLGLGRRAVDLVGQDHVGEQRPLQELELAVAGAAVLLNHLRAGDVRRHQVGRELDAAEGQRQALGQGADHQGLGQPRHALQDAVPPAEQGDQQLLDDLVLAHDHAAQLLLDVVEALAQPADGLQVVAGQVLGAGEVVARGGQLGFEGGFGHASLVG